MVWLTGSFNDFMMALNSLREDNPNLSAAYRIEYICMRKGYILYWFVTLSAINCACPLKETA